MNESQLKTGLSIGLIAVGCSAGMVRADTYGDFTYWKESSDTINICVYNGSASNVSIPGTINGMRVTSISGGFSGTFFGRTNLTSVTIPDSVTRIYNLSGTFRGCIRLTAITVDASNSIYSSLDGVVFDKTQTTLMKCPEGKCGSYVVPESVTCIDNYAFSGCEGLTNVVIGNSVTNIGHSAFTRCSNLTNVRIPDSVTSIGNSAFRSCINLTSVTIPKNITCISETSFWGCNGLTGITVDAQNSAYSSASGVLCNKSQTRLIQYPAGCKAEHYVIPSSITNIGEVAFDECLSLTNITIPSSVACIGEAAFMDCTNLYSVYFKGAAPKIGSYSFYRCNNATIYYLPEASGWGPTFGDRPTKVWK